MIVPSSSSSRAGCTRRGDSGRGNARRRPSLDVAVQSVPCIVNDGKPRDRSPEPQVYFAVCDSPYSLLRPLAGRVIVPLKCEPNAVMSYVAEPDKLASVNAIVCGVEA